MKTRALDIYPSFRCLCGACPDTCCAGWDVEIHKQTREYYLRLEGPLGERAVGALQKEDGEWSFRLEGGRCPFLMDDGLCELQKTLGPGSVSRTCRLFPRTLADFGAVREVSLSIACPEAARLLLTHTDPLRMIEWDTDEPMGYTDADGDRYYLALSLRRRLISLAQDRSLPFPVRLSLCVCLAREAAARDRSGGDVSGVLARWDDPACVSGQIAALSPSAWAPSARERLLHTIDHMERLTDRWDGHLALIRAGSPDGRWDAPEYEYENLLVYYLFRYFMDCLYDGFYLPVKLAAVSVYMIRCLWQAQPRFPQRDERQNLMRLYSREVENSQNNLDDLLSLLCRPPLSDGRALISLILS